MPSFSVHVGPIPQARREKMTGVSWKQGCPVTLDELALIRASHWDLDGNVQTGDLIVAAAHAAVVVDVLREAFEAKFPIERMQPVSDYGGSDDRSMKANNTSAFNCRPITGGTKFSEHSYGHAIDINPLRNPYVTRSGKVLPAEGEPYADRTKDFPGKLDADGVIVKAFAAHGWGWGGSWTSVKDYQHFSLTGR